MKDTKKLLYLATKWILVLLTIYFIYDIIIMGNGTNAADFLLYISEFILLVFALLLSKKGSILAIFFTLLFGVLIFSTAGIIGKVIGIIMIMVYIIKVIKK